MKKLHVLLTYDYELPLGSCSNYHKGLFEPAGRTLTLANQYKLPVTLFIDICSLIRFQEWEYEEYYVPFVQQVQKALTQGHDVQLHIHPHWMDSTFRGKQFFPSRNYTLSHFSKQAYPNNVRGIIDTCVTYMNKICKEVKPDYRCIAYRAGGYNLQPDTGQIFTALYENGIRYDSSILKNFYKVSDYRKDDYRHMPEAQNWFISLDGNIYKPADKGLLEVPITTMPTFLSFRAKRILKKLTQKKSYAHLQYDHAGTGYTGRTDGLKDKALNAYYSPLVLSFDNLTTDMALLQSITRYHIGKYKKEDNVVLCVNSHPKAFGPHQETLMKNYIEYIKQEYTSLAEFSTFTRLNQILQR